MNFSAALQRLHIADPATAEQVRCQMAAMTAPSAAKMDWIVDEIIWALAQEIGFGQAYAQGLVRLSGRNDARLDDYRGLVHTAARTGVTLAQIMARYAPPAVMAGPVLFERFNEVCAVMRAKGSYTLNAPLETLSVLLEAADQAAAFAYLDLLEAVFQQPLNYNQCLRLVYRLPEAVRGFAAESRHYQLRQAARLARIDLQLLEAYLEGLPKGLALLAEPALSLFVDESLQLRDNHRSACRNFLGLVSMNAQQRCVDLQTTAQLFPLQAALSRYLSARLGRGVPVRGYGELPSRLRPAAALVCSDGAALYLPDRLAHFVRRTANEELYKMLVRLEAGFWEIGTFDFDLERAADLYAAVADRFPNEPCPAAAAAACDGERFIQAFPCAELADDLLTLFEQARLLRWLADVYPGLYRRARSFLTPKTETIRQGLPGVSHPLAPAYRALVLCEAAAETPSSWTAAILAAWQTCAPTTVEASAAAVCQVYNTLTSLPMTEGGGYTELARPLGWRLHWPLISAAQSAGRERLEHIRAFVVARGGRIYRSALRRRLADQGGTLGAADIEALLIETGGARSTDMQLDETDLSLLLQTTGSAAAPAEAAGPTCRYPEWDCRQQDYLHEHVSLYARRLVPVNGEELYRQIVERYHGLLTRTRRAFELIKPAGVSVLRPWREGEEFDYRALLDYAVTRRMGRTAGDRLFIKRLKNVRDVAVMLLVDLSRSTANTVAGGGATVLQVTQEALVIFSEALKVVGDNFAIAGFSGSGRHAVDYYIIKSFDEALAGGVRRRIAALKPQRSTRMGAAVRHAASVLADFAARVRLLLIISDGFPNDLDYKGDYAVADTRRAIQEARSRNIHVRAITVNIGSDPRLDDLYGLHQHHVISALPELPGKLLRLYATLTRP